MRLVRPKSLLTSVLETIINTMVRRRQARIGKQHHTVFYAKTRDNTRIISFNTILYKCFENVAKDK